MLLCFCFSYSHLSPSKAELEKNWSSKRVGGFMLPCQFSGRKSWRSNKIPPFWHYHFILQFPNKGYYCWWLYVARIATYCMYILLERTLSQQKLVRTKISTLENSWTKTSELKAIIYITRPQILQQQILLYKWAIPATFSGIVLCGTFMVLLT